MKGIVSLALVCALAFSACTRVTPATTVKQVSFNGVQLMQVVQAMATAVISAENSGALSRNRAVAVMTTLKQVTDACNKVIEFLTLLAQTSEPREIKMYSDGVSRLLEVVNTGIFQAMIPIDDVTLKTDLGLLSLEISRTIATINRTILGKAERDAK